MPTEIKTGDRLVVVGWWKKGPRVNVECEFIARHGAEYEVRELATKLRHYVAADAIVSVNGKLVEA